MSMNLQRIYNVLGVASHNVDSGAILPGFESFLLPKNSDTGHTA